MTGRTILKIVAASYALVATLALSWLIGSMLSSFMSVIAIVMEGSR